MCGIAGVVNLDQGAPIQKQLLEPMAGSLVHRGPDDEGYYIDVRGRCGLAFRRLAIVDLVTGNQPIGTANEDIQVVFNGEIYNFRELRETLEANGHKFKTEGDAEVIAYAYREWGTRCFEYFNGMFAIAIWDVSQGVLTLARDRFGKKPLYYAHLGRRVYFASELKAILSLDGIDGVIDQDVLHEYLLWQYVPPDRCIYRDFAQVPPGCLLTVDSWQVSQPRPYWQLPKPETFQGTYEDALEELEERLVFAVRRRLIADVPLGAFLSGGVDSSLVVAMMHELDVNPIRTFSIGFEDPRYDETRYAKLVAEKFNTEHHAFVVTPQAESVLDTLAYHYDEPFADSSAIPTFYVSRETQKLVTVALTGDAGDEAFGGYDRYQGTVVAGRLDVLPVAMRAGMSWLAQALPHSRPKTFSRKLYVFLRALRHSPAYRYLSWVAMFPPEMLSAGYRSAFRERIDFEHPLARFERLFDGDGYDRRADAQAMRSDYLTYLPGDLLTKVDRASMAVGLECRSPFLDPELVNFALSLPIQWRQGKKILKDFAAKHLPQEVLQRPKMGFGVPIGEWFRGPLAGRLREALLASDSLCGQIFEPRWLEQLMNEHQQMHASHEHRLWCLFMLELWSRQWKPALG